MISNWYTGINTKTILLLSATAAVMISVFCYRYSQFDTNRSLGWETLKSARRPFKPGIITNGQLPADFEISLIEPKSPTPIRTKPEALCRFLVSVKIVDAKSLNSDKAPTFAFIKLFKKGVPFSSEVIAQSAQNGRTSSSNIPGTKNVGTHSIASESSRLSKSSMALKVAVLEPSAIGENGFEYIYSGEIEAPRKTGDYTVVVEIEYVILDQRNDKDVKPNPPQHIRTSIQGATLHVGR